MDVLGIGVDGLLGRLVVAAVVLSLLGSLLLVRRLDHPGGRYGHGLRSRLLLGIPWGTLVAVALVLSFYLVVQRGFVAPNDPLYVPFTSWSYAYPLGVLTAPFAHQDLGHVTGNLIGTLALAPLAEYAFSHFPTERGSAAFTSWRTNPFVRALVLFPGGVVGVGLLTSLFAWGPIIGFSGVVFAFGGFALVRYPLATVVALVARDLIGTLYYTLRDPIVTASAGPSYGPPWWAGIAIQGHLLGFLLGATLAVAIVGRRRSAEHPSGLRLWLGTVLAGTNLTIWAIWWYGEGQSYVLYRGLGLVLVVVLAGLLAAATRASDDALVGGVSRRQVGIAALALPILTMGFVAVPVNATVVNDADLPGEAIDVAGYQVTYAEGVPNRRVRAIDLPGVEAATNVTASGVIVVDAEREVWTETVSAGSLSYWGRGTTVVGGLDRRVIVEAIRRGWSTVGGPTVYQVALAVSGGHRQWVFASQPATAGPTVAGTNVTIRAGNGTFRLVATRGGDRLDADPVPPINGSARLGPLRIVHRRGALIAHHDDTVVRIATRETYA
ncbi:MAG: rhomboid family intramembrane serine protease [Halanaeroarchaeum sp.]